LIIGFMIYRFFSKNIYQRRKENEYYLQLKKKVNTFFKNSKNKNKDNVYKRCKKCKKLLKLPIPSKRGIKRVKCPKCGKSQKFIILKKQKIEIIKKKKD